LCGLSLNPQGDRAMMQAEMASNPAQVHPIHVQLDRFAAHFFWVSPGFGLWGVFDLAEHAAIALAATARFPSSVLPFCSLTFWTQEATNMSDKKWVYLFKEVDQAESYVGGDWEDVRSLLGGKGRKPGRNDPYWCSGSSRFYRHHRSLQCLPGRRAAVPHRNVGAGAGRPQACRTADRKKFGDPSNPLLVSCRSGAKFSMPGMMDTVLNIGLNDETAERAWSA
jgi:hypothetical protein